ncbi:MAG: hypothetical protein K2O18_04795 [Oscillospiraceae bacterium]|nr:hypothetical protein [Oscillospiraceae bacterium]
MQDLKYSFQLSIEQDRESILEVTVGAEDSLESAAKAKATIQQLLNDFMPEFSARPPQEKPQNPTKPSKIAGAEEGAASDSGGAKGFVLIRCEKCGNIFRSFLRSPQKMLSCKCGNHIDLAVPLAGFEYTCERCGRKNFGSTNIEDPSIEVRCSCGEQAELDWVSADKEYQLAEKESEEGREAPDGE